MRFAPNSSFPPRALRLILLALTLPCTLPAAPTPPAPTPDATIPFRTIGDSMIVIPVTINSAGPFDFLLDTGTTRTLIDPRLATQLSLTPEPTAATTLTGISSTFATPLLPIDTLTAAGQTLRNLRLTLGKSFPRGLRGILGEDFLAHFDVLIDYRRHTLQLSTDPFTLPPSLRGDRLPITLHGALDGSPTANRIIVQAHAIEFGDQTLSFLLDSGSNAFTLFPSAANGLTRIAAQPTPFGQPPQSAGELSIIRQKVRFLFLGNLLGKKILQDLTAALFLAHAPVDVDGVIPTAWFHSIFLCHTGGYVILNPTRGPIPTSEITLASR